MVSLFSKSAKRISLGPNGRSTILGVDIGTSGIRMARINCGFGQISVSNRLVIPNSDFGEAHDLLTPGVLSGQLQILKNRPLSTQQDCVCVLPRSATEFCMVEVPSGADDDVMQMAHEAVQERVDLSESTTQMWRHAHSASELVSVSCVAVKNDIAETVVDELASVGINCVGIQGHPFVAARACRLSAVGQTQRPVALLDWGHSTASLTIALNGKPEYVRVFRNCCGRNVLDAVAEGLSLSVEDARAVMANCGLPARLGVEPTGPLNLRIQRILAPEIRKVSDEIQKTLLYLKHHLSVLVPARLLLMGGMGCLQNLSQAFQDNTGLETRSWQLDGGDPSNDPAYAMAFSLSAAGASQE